MDFRIWRFDWPLAQLPGAMPIEEKALVKEPYNEAFLGHWDKGVSRIGTSNFISEQRWCHIADMGALDMGHLQLAVVHMLAGFSDYGRTFTWHWLSCP